MLTSLEIYLEDFNHVFRIYDCPIAPMKGEVFICMWEDFINDKNLLEKLNQMMENGHLFKVRKLYRKYSKNSITTVLVLS